MAQGTPELELRMAEMKVNLDAAEKAAGAVTNYFPGDTLQYTITAANVGDGLMTNPEVIDPIPAGVIYIENSASGADAAISFSIDAGRSYVAWPPTYTVRNAQGELERREATADMVTHIKWNIEKDLAPGETSQVAFQVEVSR